MLELRSPWIAPSLQIQTRPDSPDASSGFLVAPAPILGIDFLRMEGTILRASANLFRFYPVVHEAHKLRYIIAAWSLQFSGIRTGAFLVSAAQHRKGPGRLADLGVHLENHCTQCPQIVSEPAVFRHPGPRETCTLRTSRIPSALVNLRDCSRCQMLACMALVCKRFFNFQASHNRPISLYPLRSPVTYPPTCSSPINYILPLFISTVVRPMESCPPPLSLHPSRSNMSINLRKSRRPCDILSGLVAVQPLSLL